MKAAARSVKELMSQALTMEREAVARYEELANMMVEKGHHEVAQVFRQMAENEGHHVAQLLADMGWAEDTVEPREAGAWESPEAPETVPMDEVDSLHEPWNALQLARAAEERAARFFDDVAKATHDAEVRRSAEQLRAEELEHLELVRRWLERVPKP